MEMRKVQRVGHSTLSVSLPRGWVRQVGLKQGGVVVMRLSQLGELVVTPGSEIDSEEVEICRINADACKDRELLGRMITGNYILGRDAIIVSSSNELTAEQLTELRDSTRRLSGLGIVEQTERETTIQCFLDPTKFTITGLLSRLHKVAISMLETAIHSLMDRKFSLALEVIELESEADKLYWLILRQIFRTVSKIPLSKNVGVESATHVIGYRAVSKYLEEIADCSESIANQIISMADMKHNELSSLIDDICKFGIDVLTISKGAMDSLSMLELDLANQIINRSELVDSVEKDLTERVVLSVQDRKIAIALRGIVWNLAEISGSAKMISEVALNRYLERDTEACRFWKERRSRGNA